MPSPDIKPSGGLSPIRHGWLERILCHIFKRRDIMKGDGLYMRRFYLTPRSWPIRMFLHHLLLDDDDRCLHDHPWPFWSFLLAGHYTEILPGDRSREAKAGTLLRNPATHTHRVIIRRPVWSLVFTRQPERVWGFHDPVRGWVDWRTYLGLPNEPDWPEDKVAA